MNTLGIIAYGLLVFLAISWAWGIRANLNFTLGTGLSSLLMVIFAIIIPVSGFNRLHAIWMIPAGMFFGVFMMMFGLKWSISVPGFFRVFQFVRFLGVGYMRLLRLGVSKEKLQQAELENQRRMEARLDMLHTKEETAQPSPK